MIQLLGQATLDASSAAVQVQSVWDFVLKGGPMMIPIGLCSLAVVTVLIERATSLRRGRVLPPRLLDALNARLNTDPPDRDGALSLCQASDSPIARVLAAGLRNGNARADYLEKLVRGAGEREVLQLSRNVRVLSVVAAIAPLLGLLGTIFGMISAFQTVATSGEALGRAELLAKGIYEAMITTAAGLMVAIPALVGYHWISAKTQRLVSEMDRAACDFLDQHGQLASAEFEEDGNGRHLASLPAPAATSTVREPATTRLSESLSTT